MSESKFARTANQETTIEEALSSLRTAAHSGDSARIITAAGELKSLLNLFKRQHNNFYNNPAAIQRALQLNANNWNVVPNQSSPAFRDFINEGIDSKIIDSVATKSDQSFSAIKKQQTKNIQPQLGKPDSINLNKSVDQMILSGDPNVFGGTKIGKFISSLFNSNQMRNLLNEPIPNNIIRGTDQSGKPLRNISIQDLREKKAIITFYDQNSMKNYINTVSDQFSEAYQGTSMFHWIKNTVAKTLFAVTGAGLIANIAIPASAAMSMGSPSSAAMQQAANINAGGSEPVNSQPLNSKPTSPTGHPNLTNGSNFGNLGGVQGNPNLGPSNSNVPFSNRVIDYSTMYRENSVDDNRVVVAQMDQKVSIPAEAYAQINQAPDLESFMQQIIQVLQSNGGPDNPKAIEAVNAYIANVNSKIQPIMNLLSAMPEGA